MIAVNVASFSIGGLGLQGKAHFIFTATCDERQPNLALFVFIVITFCTYWFLYGFVVLVFVQ